MDIAEPRIASSSFGGRFKSGWPSKTAFPEQRPLLARRPISESSIWLFPEPDSPTMPTTSPCFISKLTRSTAVIQPCGSLNCTDISCTDRIGRLALGDGTGAALIGIECIAQPIGNVVEAEKHG